MKQLLTYFHGMTLATAILTGAFTLGVLNGRIAQQPQAYEASAPVELIEALRRSEP